MFPYAPTQLSGCDNNVYIKLNLDMVSRYTKSIGENEAQEKKNVYTSWESLIGVLGSIYSDYVLAITTLGSICDQKIEGMMKEKEINICTIEDLSNKLGIQSDQLASMQDKCELVLKELEFKKSELNLNKTMLEEKDEELSKRNRELETVNNNCEEFLKDIRRHIEEKKQILEEKESLQERLDYTKQEYDSSVKRASKTIGELQNENAKLQDDIIQMKQTLKSYEESNLGLMRLVSERDNEIEKRKEQLKCIGRLARGIENLSNTNDDNFYSQEFSTDSCLGMETPRDEGIFNKSQMTFGSSQKQSNAEEELEYSPINFRGEFLSRDNRMEFWSSKFSCEYILGIL
ncbi:hypothetical protein BB560_004468 [Smittium megazygosporum]|uniref:Uncharacterized protein n=1 Tax=Smittium megazygosporum TaxID=133381 RepID=A0A2T9Z9A5_9FUNG|nr:hypothetical protein BB560_004468 [Smittium megazygosporum]